MENLITLTYSESLIRRAVLSFWWRTVGVGFIVALIVISICLGYSLINGDRSWGVGALATILVLSVIFITVFYFSHYRNSLRKFRAMGSHQAKFSLSDSTFTLSSGAGSSTLPWSSIVEIWKFDEYWLLLFSKAQFVTLPLVDIAPEMRASILERVQSAGGKIRK